MAKPYRTELGITVRPVGHGLLSGVRAAPMLAGRAPTAAESKRRQRRGYRSPAKGHLDPVFDEPRNGLPWRPYVYRGTGRDAYDGTCAFEDVAS